MKVSLHWLRDYVDIPVSSERLAEELSLRSVEVSSVATMNTGLSPLVVGVITKVRKHPNADRLHLVTVKTGRGKTEVVCGGSNISEHSLGWKVAYAPPGTVLPSGLVIQEVRIRGVRSPGMICSAQELGFPSQREKEILVLERDSRAGQPVAKFLNLEDTVFDLDVLTNRPDLLGHVGVAREIAALFGKKFRNPRIPVLKLLRHRGLLEVRIREKTMVSRYSAFVISGITIQPSPAWLSRRLEAVGIRSINNIVDLTNYMMMDMGQPLHAFDFDKIRGKVMTVRTAREGEVVRTLDGVDRKLSKGMLVIKDRERLIDLVGIMGGEESAVDEETERIVLQAAAFDPVSIRRTSRSLDLRTEAVARYEKSVDASQTMAVLSRSYNILKEMMPTSCLEEILDEGRKMMPKKTVRFAFHRINNLLGLKISRKKAYSILESLEMKILRKQKDSLVVQIPSFRPDLNREEDLVEEIGRIAGYEHLSKTPLSAVLKTSSLPPILAATKFLRSFLMSQGFREVMNYSLISKDLIEKTGLNIQHHLEIENPLSQDQQFLRRELLSSLLQNVFENQKRVHEFRMFEIAHVFHPEHFRYPKEESILSAVIVGEQEVFFKTKGTLKNLFLEFGVEVQEELWTLRHPSWFLYEQVIDPSRSIVFQSNGKPLALVGEAPRSVLEKFEIDHPVSFFIVFVKPLVERERRKKIFHEIPHFPSVKLDLAFVIPENVFYREVEEWIRRAGASLLERIELFDVYRGKQVPPGKKSFAVHLNYRVKDRTLSLQEAEACHQKIIDALRDRFSADIRAA